MKLSLFFYFVINLLFLYKYGYRLFENNIFFILPLYIVTIVLYSFILNKYKKLLNSNKNSGKVYWLVTAFFFVLFLVINYLIDGNQLNVDRWSAMDVGIKAVLSGEYPYTAIDHLGGRTSNFPGLFLIGAPFYLLGNVGYLQVAVFLLFAIATFYFFKTNYQRFLVLGLLLLSPAYYWELVVKSDLMSNLFLVLIFLTFWYLRSTKKYFSQPVLLGFVIGVLVLTRGVVYLPLLIFMLKPFFVAFGKLHIKFIVTVVVTISLLFTTYIHFNA